MRILDDGPADAGAHEFTVEMNLDDARLRERWESAADKGGHGVPRATVRCEAGKVDPATLRASLERFNEAPDDGWRWTAEALAAHLLHDLCGVALVGWPEPTDAGNATP
ncbi:MAG: hypothetical protein OXH15_11400 [Gammaproteobacteria bacterium]|nr:hypothetical protein [Gammaproteobacteria bacterium]